MMDIALFKYYAMKNGDSMTSVATCLEKSTATIAAYLHSGKVDFRRADIAKLKKRWNLTNDQVAEIFFNEV